MRQINNNPDALNLTGVPAVLSDFDDTAAVQNVAEMLLQRFGDPSWQEVRARFRAGEIRLKEYQEITFRNIRANRTEMQDYVKQNATLRPYFKELWQRCQEHGLPMAIVSHGLDFYVEALLAKEGLERVPIYTVETQFTPQGITYQYRYTYPGREHLGNFKCFVVEQYRKQGHHVIYVGDGRSDFCAASKADTVFAHSVLAERCQQEQIPFSPFRDFNDILMSLKNFISDSHNGLTQSEFSGA